MAGEARVVMVVNNGMTHDARVIKSAHTLARAGASVVVLGAAPPGQPAATSRSGPVSYRRLAVLPARGVTPAYVRWAAERRWARLWPATDWRHALPVERRLRRAFTPVLRHLRPDAVHVHDIHLLGVALDAFGRGPDRPAIIYDAHEYVAGLAVSGARTGRVVEAWTSLERHYLPAADRVITVSDAIAGRMANDHDLTRRPVVVHNAPLLGETLVASRDLRRECGVGEDTTLAVYSGALSAARGVETAIRALTHLPDVHLAVVAVPYPHPMAAGLLELAGTVHVRDRVHFVPPVPSHEVPAYLSGADVAVSPIVGGSPSYEMALPNKLFEFVHAGLPIATSDLRVMADFVTTHHLGRVFRQGDPGDCARAIVGALGAALPDTTELRTLYSWQGQESALVGVYTGLADRHPRLGTLHPDHGAWSPDALDVQFAP